MIYTMEYIEQLVTILYAMINRTKIAIKHFLHLTLLLQGTKKNKIKGKHIMPLIL